jgi:hypothetical protein
MFFFIPRQERYEGKERKRCPTLRLRRLSSPFFFSPDLHSQGDTDNATGPMIVDALLMVTREVRGKQLGKPWEALESPFSPFFHTGRSARLQVALK